MTHQIGTPEFDEEQDRQGQAAMDQALALPITRAFFGILFFVTAFGFLVCYVAEVFGERALWHRVIGAIGMPPVFAPMLLEMAAVAFLGKSLTPWYRELMNRWRPRRK
jgi:hypothetical protein